MKNNFNKKSCICSILLKVHLKKTQFNFIVYYVINIFFYLLESQSWG